MFKKHFTKKNRQLLALERGYMCSATENMVGLMSFIWSVLSQKNGHWCVKCIPFIQKKCHHYDKNVIRTLLVLWLLIKMCLYEWRIFNLDSRWENRQGAVAGQGRLSLTQHGPCRQVHMVRQSAARTFTHTYCAHFTVEMKLIQIYLQSVSNIFHQTPQKSVFTWAAAVLLMIDWGVKGGG